MKTVQDGKWWEHFVKFCDNSELENGMEEQFIDKLFSLWEEDGKILPYVLSQKIAGDAESSLLGKVDTKELSETDYINQTLRKAAIWARQNKIYNNVLGKFLSDPISITKALRGEYYKPLFMFCSDFIDRYGQLNEEEELKKNSIRAFHPKLYNSIKLALNAKFKD